MSCPRAHSRGTDTPCRAAGLGAGPSTSPSPAPNTCAPAWLLGRRTLLAHAVVPDHGSPTRSMAVHTACSRVQSSHHIPATVCSWVWPAAQGGILDLLEPVEIPDYGEPSLVREEPWNSASPSGDRPVSRRKAVCVCMVTSTHSVPPTVVISLALYTCWDPSLLPAGA